jgi:hypothetical protein
VPNRRRRRIRARASGQAARVRARVADREDRDREDRSGHLTRLALPDEAPARTHNAPNTPELSHVLAEDLARLLVANVVVERAAEIGHLKSPAGSPNRAEARVDDTFSSELSLAAGFRKQQGPGWRAERRRGRFPSPGPRLRPRLELLAD